MAQPPAPESLWQRLAHLPGRTPLRVKLTAIVLVLVTAAVALISVTGIFFLRQYLLNQADQTLTTWVDQRTNYIGFQVGSYLSGQGRQAAAYSIQWLPKSGSVEQTTGQLTGIHNGVPTVTAAPGPTVRRGAGWLNQGNNPVTVGGSNGSRWRVVSGVETFANGAGRNVSGTVIIGMNVTNIYQTIGELTLVDVIISCILLLVLGVLAIAVISASMRSLTDIERTAQAIAAGDLSRRIPENDPRTEVGRLGRALNVMLARIESSFRARAASEAAARRSEEAARYSAFTASQSEDRMRRFVADASHELRTPLTAIRGYAEYYRQRGGAERPGQPKPEGQLTRSDLDHLIQRVEQEAKRMGVLVDDMLLLARLDQQRPLDVRTVDLLAIGADALHDARIIAPTRTINLTVGSPEAALVIGDEVGLRQVVGNLMSNAMTHTPDGTPIDITIRVDTLSNGHAPVAGEPAVILEVTDHGPGLTPEQAEHVFERFYRTDRARSRTAGGTGLGLAIVTAMISAHHGQVWVDSRPGDGATFGFALPLAPEARHAPDLPESG
ncbi:MAG TPA: HAMP domain-containing sensor histidine kinase [Streptosporangiaceae bacterium]|nr:HAMP domain-containing sensor histidine kinase [Streptosporangiaceae bacterium]